MTPDLDPFDFARSLGLVLEGYRPGRAGHDPLDRLLAACVDTVPGAEAAAISYAHGTTVRSVHSTDPAVTILDRWHIENNHGPLLGTVPAPGTANFPVLIIDDLAEPPVWGATNFASAPPFRSLCSSTLRYQHGRRTALDLYAPARGTFGPDTIVLADLFAHHAARTLYGTAQPAARSDLAAGALSQADDPATRTRDHLLRGRLVDREEPMDVVAPFVSPDGDRSR